jgi:hypothetical protein
MIYFINSLIESILATWFGDVIGATFLLLQCTHIAIYRFDKAIRVILTNCEF